MDASRLAELRAQRTFPAISLIMPTHRRLPENKQDPLRLKVLLDEAARQLRELRDGLPRGMADEVTQSLRKAAGEADLDHAAEALVLFAAPGGEQHSFVLPRVNVSERIVIDTTFVTRYLVAAMENTWSYWVLVMSEKPTRLWSGEGERLTEVVNALFPMTYELHDAGEQGSTPAAGGDQEGFFRQVERAMTEIQQTDQRPIIVLGVPRYLSYLDELATASVKEQVVGSIQGSFERATGPELSALVNPVLAEVQETARQAVIAELTAARSERRFAGGLEEVWELAEQGRIAHLIVEDGYIASANRTETHLLPAGSAEGRPVADAVDDLIEQVLATDGRVAFVSDGSLADYDRIAAVLRY
ncbi:MAG: hypothetical protein ABIS86_16075 [Streptosporangiaceae bacterium]